MPKAWRWKAARRTDWTRVDVIEQEARKLCNGLPDLNKEQLIGLHQSYAMRFVADNGNIWMTGSIFVPVAYAGPAVYYSLQDRTVNALLAVMCVSVGLIVAWFFVAEGHRAFQNKSQGVMWGIEMKLGVRVGRPKVREQDPWSDVGSLPRIAAVRRGIMLFLVVIWIAIAFTEFVLAGILLTVLLLALLQLGLALHIRNVLVASASEGARYGANADRKPDDGAERARSLIRSVLSERFPAEVSAETKTVNGTEAVVVRVRAPLPVMGLLVWRSVCLTRFGLGLAE